jgi:tetratricopeptide (TPR) repeat protein
MSEPTSPEKTDPNPTFDPALERRIEELADTYLEQLQSGAQPDRTALLSAYPDLSGPLESRLDLVEVLLHLGRSAGSGDNLPAESTLPFLADPRSLPENVGTPAMIGRFRIEKELGSGSFGRVYKAIDPQLQRTVALKVPRAGSLVTSEEQERFLREARSAARLRHEGIVTVHEIAQVNGVSCIVSDFIDGPTLSDVLPSLALDLPRAVKVLIQVADGLEHAHRAGVVHRDVKPSNILLDRSGQTHITDFGLARRDEGEATVTYTGQVLGTPAYMAPEQAAGENERVDARADVYGLGVILYQMLTGDLPFRGSARALLQQVMNEEPRPPRQLNDQVPRDLETICLKCLAKEPERRYPSAGALTDDLRRFASGQPIQARPVGRLERSWRWCRRNVALASLGLAASFLLLTVAVLGTLLAFRYRHEAQDATREKVRAEAALRSEEDARLKEAMAQANADRQQYEADAARKELEELRKAQQEKERAELPGRLKRRSDPMLYRLISRPMDDVTPADPHRLGVTDRDKTLETRNQLVRDAAAKRQEGKYDLAVASLEKVILLTRKVGGEQQALIEASTYSELAHVHLLRCDVPNAKKALQQAATVTASRFGENDWHYREARRILDDVNRLAEKKASDLTAYAEADSKAQKVPDLARKNVDEAMALAKDALATREQVLGKDHALVAASQEEVASLLALRDDVEGALATYQTALNLRKKLEGEEGPHVAGDLYSMGMLYARKGDLSKGRINLEKALSLREVLYSLDRYPHGHPDLAQSLESLSVVLRQRRDVAEGLTYAQRALAMYRSLYPADRFPKGHRDILRALDNLGNLYQLKGDSAKAMPLLKEALTMREALSPADADSPELADNLECLARCCQAEGHVKQAKNYYERAVDAQKKRVDRPNPALALSMTNLAAIAMKNGEYDQAEKLLKDVVALRARTRGKDHLVYAMSVKSLAGFYLDRGDYAKAEPLFREAGEIFKQRVGAESPDYAAILNYLGVLYAKKNDKARAEEYLTQARRIREARAAGTHNLPATYGD